MHGPLPLRQMRVANPLMSMADVSGPLTPFAPICLGKHSLHTSTARIPLPLVGRG